MGPSGDVSGNVSPVLASVAAILYSVYRILLLVCGGATMDYITVWFRGGFNSWSGIFRCADIVQKKLHIMFFVNAPFGGVGRAFSQGWGALTSIVSSPLVFCGPTGRRDVGFHGV